MPIHQMTHQSRLPARWQPLSPPQHLPSPYNNGCRAVEVEAEETGAEEAEVEEVVEEAAEEAVVEAAVEEEVRPVGNPLLHLQLRRWSHPQTMEGD